MTIRYEGRKTGNIKHCNRYGKEEFQLAYGNPIKYIIHGGNDNGVVPKWKDGTIPHHSFVDGRSLVEDDEKEIYCVEIPYKNGLKYIDIYSGDYCLSRHGNNFDGMVFLNKQEEQICKVGNCEINKSKGTQYRHRVQLQKGDRILGFISCPEKWLNHPSCFDFQLIIGNLKKI